MLGAELSRLTLLTCIKPQALATVQHLPCIAKADGERAAADSPRVEQVRRHIGFNVIPIEAVPSMPSNLYEFRGTKRR